MAELYSADEELPAEIADVVIDEPVPVGPADDEETATVDDAEDEQ